MCREPYIAINGKDEPVEIKCDPNGKPVAFIFKTIADPFLGKISLAKVISGKLTAGMEIYNSRAEKPEKLGSMFYLRGKNQGDAPSVPAGDIVALGKLQFTKTGDTLCEKNNIVKLPPVDFPQPSLYMAIEAVGKGEDEKMASGLHKLMEEDPSFVLTRNSETRQTLIGGQGDIQLGIVMSKLKDKYGVTVKTIPQKIAYRETIKGTSDVQGKHKKQSGGAGQYGDVHIRFSPSQQEFEFSEELFGGSVPKQYVPAVEKGLLECMDKGPLAGCKVVNVKAVLYDGSYHDVDSNEMAFKIAGSMAFKEAMRKADPVILEPIMEVTVNTPEEYMGDVIGDLNSRRGQIRGMEAVFGAQEIRALVPLSEMFGYSTDLRSKTQGRGNYTMEPHSYVEVPKNIADKIISERTKNN